MSVHWNREYDPNPIIDRLASTRTVDDEGKAKFEGFTYKECTAYIYDLLIFPEDLPETEGRGIVSRAILAIAPDGPITTDRILEEVNRQLASFDQRPAQAYYLATQMSLSPEFTPPPIQFRGSRIVFSRTLPPNYSEERRGFADRAEAVLFSDLPTAYTYVRARVVGRSPHEAAEHALELIDELRGIWNLFYNRQQSIRMSFGYQKPVNKIALGPFHSLHEPYGSLATDTFWYEPTYRAPVDLVKIESYYSKIREFQSYVRSRLRRTRYSLQIRNAIIRYCRALDERDWHAAYLKLWGVLESLTSTGPRDSYNVTVRRTAYVFSEYEYLRQTLNVLRDQRNRVVHASSTSEEIETYLYQLKTFVEGLIEFHLGSTFGFESISHAAQFLDLPVADSTLKHKLNLIQYARRFRGYTQHTET